MATTTTYLPGVTATARLTNLTNDGTVVTSLDTGVGDFITARVYTLTEVATGSLYTYQDGSITTDGLGTFTAYITTPTTPGHYYLKWDISIGSPARTGEFTYLFQVRTKL